MQETVRLLTAVYVVHLISHLVSKRVPLASVYNGCTKMCKGLDTDVKNALPGNPTFFQVANVLARAKKDGIVKQNANGRWMLGLGGKAKDRDAMGIPSQLNRRRRRRSKGGKARKKGMKGKKWNTQVNIEGLE